MVLTLEGVTIDLLILIDIFLVSVSRGSADVPLDDALPFLFFYVELLSTYCLPGCNALNKFYFLHIYTAVLQSYLRSKVGVVYLSMLL